MYVLYVYLLHSICPSIYLHVQMYSLYLRLHHSRCKMRQIWTLRTAYCESRVSFFFPLLLCFPQVQDAADLDTAYSSLREARDFFTSLSSHAAEKSKARFTILKELRAF